MTDTGDGFGRGVRICAGKQYSIHASLVDPVVLRKAAGENDMHGGSASGEGFQRRRSQGVGRRPADIVPVVSKM